MAVKKRYSQKREAVFDDLVRRYDHPSAAMVYESIRKRYPEVSLGTVYRNLNDLAESGRIRRLVADGRERFDGNTAAHYHFCCTECGQIFDVFDSSVVEPARRISALIHCEISDIQIVAKGKCSNCLKNNGKTI